MKEINHNDFQAMCNEYEDILRIRNYNDKWTHILLSEFDKIVNDQRWKDLVSLMSDINVHLI